METKEVLARLSTVFIVIVILLQFFIMDYDDKINDINENINRRNLEITIRYNQLFTVGIISQLNKSLVSEWLNKTYAKGENSRENLTFEQLLKKELSPDSKISLDRDPLNLYFYETQKNRLLKERSRLISFSLLLLALAFVGSIFKEFGNRE